MSHTLIRAGDPTIESFRGIFLKMRRALGTTAFGINEVRLPPGGEGLEHDEIETGHEEVYIVLEGDGSFIVDGDEVTVGPGDYLRVDPESTRRAVGGADGLRFVVVGARRAPAYDGRATL